MGNYCTAAGPDGQACGRKVENRDLGLCATHNKARRQDERPAPEPKQRKPLQARQGLQSRSTLRPVSDKQKIALAAKKEAYKEVDKGAQVCCSCGATSQLTHSHVLTVKQFPQHAANPSNILLECQDCHTVWEHNKPLAKQLHASWRLKMNIMFWLEPQYFEQFKMKYPELF
jgi:nitrate/TMAO reductase-like tetraheme cytochrome c subunit